MADWRTTARRLTADPRHAQIATLAGLLAWGELALGFELDPVRIGLLLSTAMACQAVLGRVVDGRPFDPRSATISALSLCLLLRTPDHALAVAAAGIAVVSKFAIRRAGKHVFNPTNLALVALLVTTDRAWISPGQWGYAAWWATTIACLGTLVAYRASRSDVTWAFLGAHVALLFGRAAWLGDPWSIPVHQLQSGSLLIFAFFMISDPRTTPDSRPGRIAFALTVAALAHWIRFVWWEPNALLYALVACAPLVPLIDRISTGNRFRWPTAAASAVLRGEDHVRSAHPRPDPDRERGDDRRLAPGLG